MCEHYKKYGDKYRYTQLYIYMWRPYIYFNEAAYRGFINILKWLKNERCTSNEVLNGIIEENQLETLKYLNELGDIKNQVISFIVKEHHFELIKWAHTNTNLRCSRLVYTSAADNCVEILKYLYVNKRKFDNVLFDNCTTSTSDSSKYYTVRWRDASFTIKKTN